MKKITPFAVVALIIYINMHKLLKTSPYLCKRQAIEANNALRRARTRVEAINVISDQLVDASPQSKEVLY